MNKVGAAFGGSGFSVVWRPRESGANQLLRYVTALYGSRKHFRDTGSPGAEVNESLLNLVSLLVLGSHEQVLRHVSVQCDISDFGI